MLDTIPSGKSQAKRANLLLLGSVFAIGAEEPDYPTEVKVLACPDGLYIGMRMEEPMMAQRHVGAPDNLVYQNDGVYRCDSSWRTNYKGNNRDVSVFGDIILPDPIQVK